MEAGQVVLARLAGRGERRRRRFFRPRAEAANHALRPNDQRAELAGAVVALLLEPGEVRPRLDFVLLELLQNLFRPLLPQAAQRLAPLSMLLFGRFLVPVLLLS